MESAIMKKVVKLLKELEVSDQQLQDIIINMDQAFTHGLDEDASKFMYCPLKMFNTYLTSCVIDESITGIFFAVDLGGTNLRVYVIELQDQKLIPKSFPFVVPSKIMTGDSDDLFDYIAGCIKTTLHELGMEDIPIPRFGFTFSFPYIQESLTSGRLIKWTKGYNVRGVIGQDVVALLKKSCQKLGLNIHEFVIVNDTTGTLLLGSYEDRDTVIGVINGTGTNACYVEEASNVKKWKNELGSTQVLINTEWGAFGEYGALHSVVTEFDLELDKNSINPKHQIYEKMISGMYVGELVRLALLKIDRVLGLFLNGFPKKLKEKDSFTAPLLSLSYEKENFIMMFESLFGYSLSENEYNIIFYVCKLISYRSASLLAAGLGALIKRVKATRCVIAADGSMFKCHPTMTKDIEKILERFIPQEKNFKIILVSDGSGKGAALAASVATSIDRSRRKTKYHL